MPNNNHNNNNNNKRAVPAKRRIGANQERRGSNKRQRKEDASGKGHNDDDQRGAAQGGMSSNATDACVGAQDIRTLASLTFNAEPKSTFKVARNLVGEAIGDSAAVTNHSQLVPLIQKKLEDTSGDEITFTANQYLSFMMLLDDVTRERTGRGWSTTDQGLGMEQGLAIDGGMWESRANLEEGEDSDLQHYMDFKRRFGGVLSMTEWLATQVPKERSGNLLQESPGES